MENLGGMGVERNPPGLQTPVSSGGHDLAHQFLVAAMDSIKVADGGYHTGTFGGQRFERAINLHGAFRPPARSRA